MRLKKCFLLFSLLSSCVLQAQDTLQVSGEPQKFTKKQSPTTVTNVIDTVVDKQDFFKKEIKDSILPSSGGRMKREDPLIRGRKREVILISKAIEE